MVIVITAPPALQARVVVSERFELSAAHPVGSAHQGIRLRGSLRLRRPRGGPPLAQLSGLAWDSDEGLLYALSDDGYLVHLTPRFDDGILVAAVHEAHFPLQDATGEQLTGYDADTESLAIQCSRNGIRGDSELMVGFEITPRIHRYTPGGVFVRQVRLAEQLAAADSYGNPNQQLEAIELDAQGQLWVAPERPLTHDVALGRLFPQHEASWAFELSDQKFSGVTALAFTRSGHHLILERRFSSIFTPLRVALKRLRLNASNHIADVDTLAVFDGAHGWRVDNFEGLARHEGDRYFMVSDDNDSRLQRTLLVYFELLAPAAETAAATARADAASVRPDYTGACGNRVDAR